MRISILTSKCLFHFAIEGSFCLKVPEDCRIKLITPSRNGNPIRVRCQRKRENLSVLVLADGYFQETEIELHHFYAHPANELSLLNTRGSPLSLVSAKLGSTPAIFPTSKTYSPHKTLAGWKTAYR